MFPKFTQVGLYTRGLIFRMLINWGNIWGCIFGEGGLYARGCGGFGGAY